jgi:serine protease Do
MEVPAEWDEVDGAPVTADGLVVARLLATPNLAGFSGAYSAPGVLMEVWPSLQANEPALVLDFFDHSDDCTYDGRYDYDDGLYVGQYDYYVECGGTGAAVLVLSVERNDRSHAVLLIAQEITSADVDAVDQVLSTFDVVGALPAQP